MRRGGTNAQEASCDRVLRRACRVGGGAGTGSAQRQGRRTSGAAQVTRLGQRAGQRLRPLSHGLTLQSWQGPSAPRTARRALFVADAANKNGHTHHRRVVRPVPCREPTFELRGRLLQVPLNVDVGKSFTRPARSGCVRRCSRHGRHLLLETPPPSAVKRLTLRAFQPRLDDAGRGRNAPCRSWAFALLVGRGGHYVRRGVTRGGIRVKRRAFLIPLLVMLPAARPSPTIPSTTPSTPSRAPRSGATTAARGTGCSRRR